MKVTTFQNVVPFACALIPVNVKFAKIQMAETPPRVPSEPGEDLFISIDLATSAKTIKHVPTTHELRIEFLSAVLRMSMGPVARSLLPSVSALAARLTGVSPPSLHVFDGVERNKSFIPDLHFIAVA